MVDKIVIDEKASTSLSNSTEYQWAREKTLEELVVYTGASNKYLQALSKTNLSGQDFKKANDESKKIIKDGYKSTIGSDKDLGNIFGKNITNLQGSLSSNFKSLSMGITSISSHGIVGMLGEFASDASIGLRQVAQTAGPLVGGLALMTAELAAGLLVYAGAYQITEKLSENYQQLYVNGINFNDGLVGMTKAAGDVGLSTADLVTSFNQFSGVVTYLGTNKATKLAKQFTELNRVSGDLGLTNQEAADALLNYTDMLRSTGTLTGKSDRDLIKGTYEYLTELNQVANITGKNRKELEKEAKDRAKDLDLNLAIARLPIEVQDHIRKSMVHLSAFGDQADNVGKVLKSLWSTGGLANLGPELQLTISQLPGLTNAFSDYQKTLENGTSDQIETAQEKIAEILQGPAAKDLSASLASFAEKGGTINDAGKTIIAMMQSSQNIVAHHNKIQKAYNDELAKNNNKNLTEVQKKAVMDRLIAEDAAGINDSNRDMIQAQNALSNAGEKIASSFNTLVAKVIIPTTPLLLKLADGLIFTLDSVNKAIDIYSIGFKELGSWISDLSDSFESFYKDSWLQKTVNVIATPITWLTGLFTKLGEGIDKVLTLFGYDTHPGEKSGDTGDHDRNRSPGSSSAKWFNLSNFTTGAVITGLALVTTKVLATLGMGGFKIAKGLASPLLAGGKGLWNAGKGLLGRGAVGAAESAMEGPGLLSRLTNPLFGGKSVIAARAARNAASGVGSIDKVAEGIGKAEESIAGLTNKLSGVQPAKVGFLTSLSNGIASFGNPKVALGAAVIVGMGLGFAGILYATAKAIQQFENIKWPELEMAGVTLLGIGTAMGIAVTALTVASPALAAAAPEIAAFGASLLPVAVAIDGFALAIGGVALAIGGALRLATPALQAFGDIITKTFSGISLVVSSVGKDITSVIDSFTKMNTVSIMATTNQIERLSKIPSDNMIAAASGITSLKNALSDFQPGLVKGISNFFGALFTNDPVKQLQKLADIGPNLTLTAASLGSISKSYTDAVNSLNVAKIDDSVNKTIENLGNILFVDNKAGFWSGKVTTASKVQELADSIGSLAAKTAELQRGALDSTPAGVKLLSPSDLQKRMLSFYDDQKTSNAALIQLLQMVNIKLDVLDKTTEDGADKMADAVKKASGHLY